MANIEHLSYSSVSAYLLCGEAWRRRYVVKEPAPVASSIVLGSAFHGAIEAYLKGAPDLEAAYEQAWAQQLERGQDVVWEDGQPDTVKADGLRMVRAKPIQELLDQLRANFDPEHGPIERRVELRVPGVPVPIIGYVDVVTKDGIPGDFKTANRMWSDEKAGDELQPLFYLAALNQEGIQVPNWTFRHYVFSRGQHPSAKVFEVQRKPSEVFWLFERIQRAWEGIERSVYLVNPPDWKCSSRYCEYWIACRGKWQ